MPIAPLQPHKSWYGNFWYAERSPRDTLADRSLLFAIVVLSLVAGGMVFARHHAGPAAQAAVPGEDSHPAPPPRASEPLL
jgi:hypothetical protein